MATARSAPACCVAAVALLAVASLVGVGRPVSLLEMRWDVPQLPAWSTGFAAGRTLRPDGLQSRIPGTMADVMHHTQAERRGRYAERGYGWHDPKFGVGEAVEAAVKPLVGEISEMEEEIEDEQHEIRSLQTQTAEHAPPAQHSAAQTVRFAIPGAISIDHLTLPSGTYSMSLGLGASNPVSSLKSISEKHPARAEDATTVKTSQLTSISHPTAKSKRHIHHRDPLDILAESLSAPARRTQLAMAQLRAPRDQRAAKSRAREHPRAHMNVKSPGVAARPTMKQGKTGVSAKTIFHHVHVKGARKAGGHAVAKIVAGMVQEETSLTPAERAFAAATMGQPNADLHAATSKLRLVHGAKKGDKAPALAWANDRQKLQHKINMLNVDKLEQVSEQTPKAKLQLYDNASATNCNSMIMSARDRATNSKE
jgi:hypothetical protein